MNTADHVRDMACHALEMRLPEGVGDAMDLACAGQGSGLEPIETKYPLPVRATLVSLPGQMKT